MKMLVINYGRMNTAALELVHEAICDGKEM